MMEFEGVPQSVGFAIIRGDTEYFWVPDSGELTQALAILNTLATENADLTRRVQELEVKLGNVIDNVKISLSSAENATSHDVVDVVYAIESRLRHVIKNYTDESTAPVQPLNSETRMDRYVKCSWDACEDYEAYHQVLDMLDFDNAVYTSSNEDDVDNEVLRRNTLWRLNGTPVQPMGILPCGHMQDGTCDVDCDGSECYTPIEWCHGCQEYRANTYLVPDTSGSELIYSICPICDTAPVQPLDTDSGEDA